MSCTAEFVALGAAVVVVVVVVVVVGRSGWVAVVGLGTVGSREVGTVGTRALRLGGGRGR